MSTKRNRPELDPIFDPANYDPTDLQTFTPLEELPEILAEMEQMTFSDYLHSHRYCEEWTQAEVALKLGISKQLLSAYERGKKLPSLTQALRITEALGMAPTLTIFYVLRDQVRQAGVSDVTIEVRMKTG